ncbi:uncharacterized protein LOC116434007 [Nomia melanderi]|uniref:uncharacterized protein LOC116434007 n=1 Tax=Nomia melanderi TaxID=2448451 RepID=UPI0013041E6F|nr:uncharacterized protein LOC116434007 isoform X1 [Nomia melanderi]XP_031848562.1 uncharacterized protein LOC116434007 isoform X1 [Nomia melanderi]
MSKFYHCILCQNINASIVDLHNHHIRQHTLEELSYTIIDLQGFQFNKENSIKSVILSNNNNNNKNLCNHFVIKTEKPDYHDEMYCSLHCSPYIAWEQELNKRIDITDDVFFSVVENLCADLSKRKQRGTKSKNKANPSNTKTKENVIWLTDNDKTKTANKPLQESNHLPMQISRTASSSIEHSVHNTMVNNEIFNIEYNNVTALTLLDMEPDKHFLIYDPSNASFSLGSIDAVSSENTETLMEETVDSI